MQINTAIVIVSWNGMEDLLKCLASLEKLDPPRPRIVVVDNGSTDGTGEAVRDRFPEVELLSLSENLGFAGGNNRGIERALGGGAEYVCLLNNDTAVDPGFLNALLRAAGEFPRAGILGSRVLYRSRPETVWSQGISVGKRTGRVYAAHYNRPAREVPETPENADGVSGAAMLLRAETLRQTGLFDEDYFLCFEDLDLCLRGRERGWEVMTVPASKVYHSVSGSMGGEYSPRVVYYSTRNHFLLLNRRFPFPPLPRGIRNLRIAIYTALFALFTAKFQPRPWARGILDYARGRLGKIILDGEWGVGNGE
ncbi:MAG: glycosyltransferase family 2 protein [Candidatus Erginobacter occultus]|nr:glycosyltransferase family 2 protein [Candidatus Erginobacter occultus]